MFSSNTSQVSEDANYIESCFSTYLYTGNGSTQTINNGIDLAGKGGLVWTKKRNSATQGDNMIVDTANGLLKTLITNSTAAAANYGGVDSFNASGYTLTSDPYFNGSGSTYVGWTFRKQPKFFDVVTYTGNGVDGRTVAHNLGSVPGCIIVKNTGQAQGWAVYHRSLSPTQWLRLETTNAASTFPAWADTTPTATVFSVGNTANTNAAGNTYVAYLFAHNAGGFGLTGTDNVISCGIATSTGSGTTTVNLGYEPQWILIKGSNVAGYNWNMFDNMRGMGASGNTPRELNANLTNAEGNGGGLTITSTGFTLDGTYWGAVNLIYIAIRRGPMKTPTSGTSVFAPVRYTTSPEGFITGFPVDFGIAGNAAGTDKWYWQSRLQGAVLLNSASTAAEVGSGSAKFDMMNGYGTGFSTAYWAEGFRRAPGFFDEICFSGTGANKTETHNLGVPPELWLVKSRSGTTQWVFGSSLLAANEKIVMPSPNGRVTDATVWNSTYPTASALSLGTSSTTNASGQTFVGYMWATVAGVSKVGMYTGNGTSQTIDCGFTGGARFVMIIRATTSTAQDIYIWDSARGIVAGNDPRLSLNTTAAEVTSLDTIDTAASGFVVNTDASNVNVNGAVYLYLSIA